VAFGREPPEVPGLEGVVDVGQAGLGEHDADYRESWPVFAERVLGALDRIGEGTTVVTTSGGPVAVVVATLLESPAAYQRIAPVAVNAAVTRVVTGSRGRTLVSFNEHTHLTGDLLTYR
jgi:broad specificity phosphatase PhoE